MPTKPSMAILFLLFLALFVLIGTSPVLHRLLSLLGTFFRNSRRLPGGGGLQPGPDELTEQRWKNTPLNDYEIMVIRKIALSGGKGMSRKALAASLYFQPSTIDKSLKSLSRKGLLRSLKVPLFGERYDLSSKGHDYALEQDLIPRLSKTGPPSG